jgi:hypothetical protein
LGVFYLDQCLVSPLTSRILQLELTNQLTVLTYILPVLV